MSRNLLASPESIYLQNLDWPYLVNNICSLAHFDDSKEYFWNNLGFESNSLILTRLDELSEFIDNFEKNSNYLQGFFQYLPTDLKQYSFLNYLDKGGLLEFSQLNILFILFEFSTSQTHLSLPRCSDPFDADSQKIIRKNLKSFRIICDKNGKLTLSKHPKLRPLIEELSQIDLNIREKLNNVLKTEPFKTTLQIETYDQIDDKYVIPIKTDSYSYKHGQIIGRSNTGMTLFVEPPSIREIANRRSELQARIEEVKNIIALEYVSNLCPFAPQFLKTFNMLRNLDVVHCKASYSLRHDFTRPEFSCENTMQLKNFYHPLITNPVKNNLILERQHLGLIISGPNTGGKTVALKAIAICHLLFTVGMYVPADEAKIYPLRSIYFFSNDLQNIREGLSSFSSEVNNYLSLLDDIKSPSLVFIDEIFNSTSSDEASALAISYFNNLKKISPDIKILVSTHHQLLKSKLQQNNDYLSASVGFNAQDNTPTYLLHFGDPGSSMALETFKRLSRHHSVGKKIFEEASEILDQKALDYEKLLQNVSEKKEELESLIAENESTRRYLNNKKSQFDSSLKLKTQSAFVRYEQQAKTLISDLRALYSEMKKGKKITSKEFDAAISKHKHNLSRLGPQINTNADRPHLGSEIPFDQIKLGENYFSFNLNKTVKVSSLNERKKEVLIAHGNFSSWIPFHDLRLPNKNNGTESSRQSSSFIVKDTQPSLEHDCRGMRLNDFQKLVEDVLFDLEHLELPFVDIIHGHGDGVLKEWLRKKLKNSKNLSWSNLDGNDGCTRIQLKN